MQLVRKHKRRSNYCRNYFCCCICCFCDNFACCDRRYRRFLKFMSRLWMHKGLVLTVLFLIWFILANLFFWFHDFTDNDSKFDKYTSWIPKWFKNYKNFGMINLAVGTMAVAFQLYCVLMWYAAHYKNEKSNFNKKKIEKKYETLKSHYESLLESNRLLSSSNTSLERSFDSLTHLSENFESILHKYDLNLNKLSQFYSYVCLFMFCIDIHLHVLNF